MSLFNDLKSILFSDIEMQQALIKAIRNKDYAAKDFDDAFNKLFNKVDEHSFQLILAPFLRASAIKHLREGTTVYTQEFRQNYDAVVSAVDTHEIEDALNVTAFLNQQSQAYIYATDIEAGALAELLGMTFACTQVNSNNLSHVKPAVYYRSAQVNAPIVHLYNRSRDHFFVVEGIYNSTIGDGNCLYNGFAQILRQFILIENQEIINVYVEQEKIYSQIKNLKPLSVDELIKRIHTQHETPAEKEALEAAIQIANSDEIIESESINNTTDKPINPVINELFIKHERRLLDQILSLRRQAFLLRIKGDEKIAIKIIKLADNLKSKTDDFLKLEFHAKKQQFNLFKDSLREELDTAKNGVDPHRECKQVFLDIFQTLTVIGAVLGGIQWAVNGKYSLFSSHAKTSNLIEETKEVLTELALDF